MSSRARHAGAALVAAALWLLVPSPAGAWGFDAHWFIMERAIDLLPAPIKPLFEKHRALVVQRAIDPDTWRTAGFEAEPKRHFLDLDWEGYGKDPYKALPRDLTAAVAKFGRSRIEDNGTLPWQVEEHYGNLRRAFEAAARRGAFAQYDVMFFSAWLAHYVADGHQPFHAVVNYDGQLTQQFGIHARFESFLFERYRKELTIVPKPQAAVSAPRDFMFDRLVEGTRLTAGILAADAAAIGQREAYDDAYYSAFFKATRATLERRLAESISGVAAMIAGAWEAAGKPTIQVNPTAAPERRRRS